MSNFIHDTVYPTDFFEKKAPRFKPAAVFSNHAVFQRDMPFRVFGECPNGSFVTAVLMHKKKWVASAEGMAHASDRQMSLLSEEFMFTLKPQPAGTDYELRLTCKWPDGHEDAIIYTDLAFGEVWLAGGQSNMELELQNCSTGKESLKKDKNPNVRFYYTQKYAWFGEEFFNHEDNSGWSCFDSESAKCWSAVGYYFAKELSEKLGCIVGVIGCNWGGTSASAWTDINILKGDSELYSYIEDYATDKSLDDQKAELDEYDAYAAEWQKRIDAFYAEHPKAPWNDAMSFAGECRYPGPHNSFLPMRPSGLYETMLKRVAPYTMRGVIFYQSESDDHKPALYSKLFTKMIINWRALFKAPGLPFIFVQLPVHQFNGDPDYKNWCILRNEQQKVFDNVKNTGMAVAFDLGAFDNIHPTEKTVVAHRLCLQALCRVYGLLPEDRVSGPTFSHALVENYGKKASNGVNLEINLGIGADWEQESATVRIFLKNEKGLTKKESVPEGDTRPLNEIPEAQFELSENGKTYYPAIWNLSKDTINLTCDEVTHPRFVRYAWTNYCRLSIFGANGIPLAPFCKEI